MMNPLRHLPLPPWPMRVTVAGHSMAPLLMPGDSLVALRQPAGRLRLLPGDLVVVRRPDQPGLIMVKRVIGLPGERVRVRADDVLVDGMTLLEPYAYGSPGPPGDWLLPPGSYFVLGDNREASTDSRAFGPVPTGMVMGRIVYRYLPGPRRCRLPRFGRLVLERPRTGELRAEA